MRTELTDDPGAFRARDWNHLVDADPEGTFFHTPQYLKTWWEEFGQGGKLLLAFVADGDEPVAVCGFDRRGDRLTFLGGFDVTDYMGPVGAPGAEDRVAKELVRAVTALEGWTRADLAGLPSEGRWLPALETAAAEAGLGPERGDDGVMPRLDLPPTFEEYEAGLPPKLRHEMRRKARRLEREAGGYELVPTTRQNLTVHVDRFVELHRSSEGPKGKFMYAGMELFFRHLADDFVDEGTFRLTFLRAAGELVAGAIAFRHKDAVYLYNSAFDHRFRQLSPGMVLVAELIRGAIEEGLSRFDMLKGDLEYKYRFGAVPRPVVRLALGR